MTSPLMDAIPVKPQAFPVNAVTPLILLKYPFVELTFVNPVNPAPAFPLICDVVIVSTFAPVNPEIVEPEFPVMLPTWEMANDPVDDCNVSVLTDPDVIEVIPLIAVLFPAKTLHPLIFPVKLLLKLIAPAISMYTP